MYGKFFACTFTGSMVGSGTDVFALWGYVIANKDEHGMIELNPHILAAIFGKDCTAKRIQAAIQVLCSIDDDSRNAEEEGRRLIQEGPFLYRVVSHTVYQNIRNNADKREYFRKKQQESRARKKLKLNNPVKIDSLTNGALSTMSKHIDVNVNKDLRQDQKKEEIYARETALEVLTEFQPGRGRTGTPEYAISMILAVCPKRQSGIKVEWPFMEACQKTVADGTCPDTTAAIAWLMGRALLYYELATTTWAPDQLRYMKIPSEFFIDEIYRENQALWDRSNEGENNGNAKNRANRADVNHDALQQALQRTREAPSAAAGNGPADDGARQAGKPGSVADLFASPRKILPNGSDTRVRASGGIAQIVGDPRKPR